MLGLPQSTEFNKRIPKQKFYENISVTPVLKRIFTDQIKTIYWRNKIAAATVNLAAGKNVTEIEIIEIKLASTPLDEAVLRQIDKEIPYHIVFLLEYEGKYQAWTSYKEVSSGNTAFKVGTYYHTDWMPEDELPLRLEGLDLDVAYEQFVRQIAGDTLSCGADTAETLTESIEREEKRKKLQKQIEVLEVKLRREKQLNKQILINSEIKRLKRELEGE